MQKNNWTTEISLFLNDKSEADTPRPRSQYHIEDEKQKPAKAVDERTDAILKSNGWTDCFSALLYSRK